MKRSHLLLVALLLALLTLSACMPAANEAASPVADVAGFWSGLWHGAIMLFTFVISLFNDNVGIYEVNNNGGWYDFGYMLGALMFLGGGSGGAARGKKR